MSILFQLTYTPPHITHLPHALAANLLSGAVDNILLLRLKDCLRSASALSHSFTIVLSKFTNSNNQYLVCHMLFVFVWFWLVVFSCRYTKFDMVFTVMKAEAALWQLMDFHDAMLEVQE